MMNIILENLNIIALVYIFIAHLSFVYLDIKNKMNNTLELYINCLFWINTILRKITKFSLLKIKQLNEWFKNWMYFYLELFF